MSAERLREMLAASTPGPWEARDGEGEGVWAHGYRQLALGAYGKRSDLRLAALAPDAIALLADMAELLGSRGVGAVFSTVDEGQAKHLLARLDALCGDDRATGAER